MGKYSGTTFAGFMLLALFLGVAPQQFAQTTNVTTGHQDIPSTICSGTGCVYRTGQNLQESVLDNTISKNNFGQFCNYTLDGQVYGQPLVVTGVPWMNGGNQPVVYVVTMNGTIYAFNGSPTAPSGSPGSCTLLNSPNGTSLLNSGSAATCDQVGGKGCLTIAPSVGVLGTPVISVTSNSGTNTGTIYLVTESVTSGIYSHYLWALDITTLSTTSATMKTIDPGNTLSGNCSADANFSKNHIQRPALLLGGDGYLYIAFSMMDGHKKPYPYGAVFAYDTTSLSTKPLCLALAVSSTQLNDGAGVWGGGGGPLYAQDPNHGAWHVFFNTGNGGFDGQSLWGDTFVRMSSASTHSLSVDTTSYTPGDQYWRSHSVLDGYTGCSADGDVDLGSGSPMLIPDNENSDHKYLAVSGDKEGGLWFMDWTSPGGYTGTSACNSTSSTDLNVQTFPISSAFRSGPLIHHTPAFWESCCASPNANYLFVGASSQGQGTGYLYRYQLCGSGKPINSNSPCTQTPATAQNSTGAIEFPWGATPSVTAATDSASDAIVWAIWADGTDLPASTGFTWQNGFPHPPMFNAAQTSGRLKPRTAPTPRSAKPATLNPEPTTWILRCTPTMRPT
jgi:hypothetical protein